ncbi:MAG: hypothetical protein P8020_20205 [Acidobacteriota bacterium]
MERTLSWLQELPNRLGLTQDQAVLILIVLGAVLLAVIAWLLLRRRRPRSVDLGIDLDLCRQQNPCLFKVVMAVSEQGLADQLRERGDVRAALKLLATRDAERRARQKDRRSSMLDLPGQQADNRRDAAVMTILRAVYMDEVLCRALPSDVVGEVDSYLDSLTA